MSNPMLDKRKAKEIEKSIKDLIPTYLPHWRPEPGEPGWAIAQTFSKMAEEIIERFNQVPEKLFFTFLDKLGAKISPPLPSKAPVTFYLAEGVTENKTIPAKVCIATREQVNFETEKAFTATTASLKAFFSVNPLEDKAFNHSENIKKGTSITLFKGKKGPQHVFYLGDDCLFNLNKGVGENLYVKLTLPFLENCYWQYWGKGEDGKEDWRDFEVEIEGNTIKLYKQLPLPTSKKEINGHKAYWIRAVLKDNCFKEIKLTHLNIAYESKSGVDALFYNDVPIDLNVLTDKDLFFYPFGPEPKLQDTFYIASNEALSKKGLEIELRFFVQEKYTKEKIEEEPVFSWEYWNGMSWKALSYKVKEWYFDFNGKKKFFPISLIFTCPEDIAPTEVNGQKNYWIRVRLIGGGYGRYYMEGGNLKKEFNPPKISSLCFYVEGIKTSCKQLLTYNNLSYDEPSVWPASIFSPLSDKYKTIYLGFDRPFNEGLITLFFSLVQKYGETERYLEWSYFSKEGWKPLNVRDGTHGLTQSGICEFMAPLDQEKCQKFNRDLYWLKIELVEKIPLKIHTFLRHFLKIYPQKLVYKILYEALKEQRQIIRSYKLELKHKHLIQNFLNPLFYLDLFPSEEETVEINPCPLDLRPFHPALHSLSEEKGEQIELKGIYLNTVWATQTETIEDEIIGSSDGSPNQKFTLLRPPVMNLKLWVKEPLPPAEASLSYYKDEEGFWVLWEEVEDLQFSSSSSRHYILDPVTGEIQFGDGQRGLIPPIGRDNLKATYKTGGGKKGNVAAGKIDTLVTPVAYVDRVTNHEEASGGADREDVNSLVIRAPKRLKTRLRAITIEDYELLAKEASTEIAKVKVISNLDHLGQPRPNWVTIIVVPESKNLSPMPSQGLLKRVENYLKARCPLTIHLQVIPPVYAKVDVEAVLLIKKWKLLSSLKKKVQEEISSFLHPLYGGKEEKGWDFGVVPCLSDIFSLLNKIPGVLAVKELKLILRASDQKLVITPDSSPLLDISSYVLVTSGLHHIILRGE